MMISATTGKEITGGKKMNLIEVNSNRCIEVIDNGEGVSPSYNVLRTYGTKSEWYFYKSAYTLESAMKKLNELN